MQTVWRWKPDGSYVEPKEKLARLKSQWIAELSYPQALKKIDKLHHSFPAQHPTQVRCFECLCTWPCSTNQIINKARLRQTGEKNGESVRAT